MILLSRQRLWGLPCHESLMGHASRSVRQEARTLAQLIDATPIPLRDT